MTTNDKILQQKSLSYICSECNFITSNKFNFNKHILTSKHLKVTNELQKNANNAKIFECDCGKVYKFRQGLFSHMKKCLNKSNVNQMVDDTINGNKLFDKAESLIMEIIKENQEFKSLIIEQQKENKELINKMVEISQQPTTVNNNTNNNNQSFNLNFFLNETCKDAMNIQEFLENIFISFDELLTIGNAGFVNGVSDIFIKRLRDLEVTKRPIHCTDAKREIP